MRKSAASPATQLRLVVDTTRTSVGTALWGASTARLFLGAEALVCHGSREGCHLESCSGTAMSFQPSCLHKQLQKGEANWPA